MITVKLSPQPRYCRFRPQKRGRGHPAQRADDLRAYRLYLPYKIRLAFLHLGGKRRPVFRRPAFENVGDENVLPFKAHRHDHARKQLPGPAHEWLAFLVLIRAGGFADKHEPCAGSAHAEYGLCPCLAKRAKPAFTDIRRDLFKAFLLCLLFGGNRRFH